MSTELRQVAHKIQALQNETSMIREDSKRCHMRITNLADQLRNLESVKTRRMEFLKMRHRDLPAAVDWVRQNQEKFRSEVFEPICLLVSICFGRPELWFYTNAFLRLISFIFLFSLRFPANLD
jgi:structural maintenance of chromosomes protein 5